MTPLNKLTTTLKQSGLIKFLSHFAEQFSDIMLKDLSMGAIGEDRKVDFLGKTVTNFGSDSFLGLDQDDRVKAALRNGIERWGSHNGASRAFSSVETNVLAEEKLAEWLGIEAVLIYPSVTLANVGAIPGLVGKQDIIVLDQHCHNSIQEGAKIAKANGSQVLFFEHCDPSSLAKVLQSAGKYRHALVAIDGIYSMSGVIPPLKELNKVCMDNNAILYVDDAHATGVVGTKGRGTVLDAVGNYENILLVGSLSKGFSCLGGFIGCTQEMKSLLKWKSNTFIFGGPVGPPYLDAICTVCDILSSGEYELIIGRLKRNLNILVQGLRSQGLQVLGGATPIVSVVVGDEEQTLKAGHILFQKGFYVQSVIFPAVPYHGGVLRIQVNANHRPDSVKDLVNAFKELQKEIEFPTAVLKNAA
jgi:7-keto-8-aminopelargonate synthetase-like enzyme